ncbi:MAG TPA: hypothetical protein DEH78_09570 [Solibacterales bacterium]|nr:hypothetical protein [Bryobacterales bacterium]
MSLSQAQQRAVRRTGQDVCVVAGPGSGKTLVLVERFAWLVEQGTSPLRILAITFTEKAAFEIKRRLVERFASDPDARRQIERAYVSTLHAFCLRLLKENALAAGLDPRFELLDEREQTAELNRALRQSLDELYARRPRELRDLLESWRREKPEQDILAAFEALRLSGKPIANWRDENPPEGAFQKLIAAVREMRGASPPPTTEAQARRLAELDSWLRSAPEGPVTRRHFDFLKDFACNKKGLKEGHPIHDRLDDIRGPKMDDARAELVAAYYAPQRETLIRAVERFDEIYRNNKREAARLDFSDLEEQAIALLRSNAELRRTTQENFEAVLMDELQDTNPLQWELMDLVRRPGRFFAVGDINQSIFGFRHAEPGVFERFRERVARQGEVDCLSENYRSRAEVLGAVDRVCEGMAGIASNPLEARRRFTRSGAAVEVVGATAETVPDAERIEARWIARRIRDLHAQIAIEDRNLGPRPARFRDFAVLVRNSASVGPLEPALAEFGVPYLLARGKTFFEEPEVTDLVAVLRAIENPLDEIAFAAVARSPLFGLSDEALLRFKLDHKDPEEFAELRALLDEVRPWKDELPPDRLLGRVLDERGYEDSLQPAARANIDKLLALLRDWHASRPSALREWLDQLEGLRAEHEEPSAPANDSPDAVSVMTIHAAKGLEFPVVFLAAMHKGVDARKSSLLYRPGRGLGMRWRDPFKDQGIPDAIHLTNSLEVSDKERCEADRLLYVAMTRAEERLLLSFSYKREEHPKAWPEQVLAGLGLDFQEITISEAPDAPELEQAETERSTAEAEPVARPEVSRYEATASVTAIAQFAECPRRYYLERYLGLEALRPRFHEEEEIPEDRTAGELSASELGTMVHEILAGTFAGAPAPEARDLASRFDASELGRRAAGAVRIEREWDFVHAVEDIVLRGQIDLWFEEEDGRTVLIDYKTDRDESRIGHYALQLRLYAAAIEKMTGRSPSEAWLFFLRSGRAAPVQVQDATAWVARFKEAQDRQSFPLETGAHCRACPFFRGRCPAVL